MYSYFKVLAAIVKQGRRIKIEEKLQLRTFWWKDIDQGGNI